jgi:hypothetical protein
VSVTAGAAGRTQTALRVEQEDTGGDDLLAFFQAFANLYTGGELHADGDGPRLESITGGHEDVLLQAGIDDRITWHGQDLVSDRFKGRRSIQAGPQRATGVSGRQADA